jgi:hypothetical protein
MQPRHLLRAFAAGRVRPTTNPWGDHEITNELLTTVELPLEIITLCNHVSLFIKKLSHLSIVTLKLSVFNFDDIHNIKFTIFKEPLEH